MYVVINDGWNVLEPGIWIIGLIWYSMSIFVVGFLKKELSLNPFQFYTAIKEYKLEKLRDKYKDWLG